MKKSKNTQLALYAFDDDLVPELIRWFIVGLMPLFLLSLAIVGRMSYVFVKLYDDAYYYIVVGQNLSRGLGSTFDGVHFTNGYHPLWALLSAAVAYTINAKYVLPVTLIAIQILFATVGAFLFYYAGCMWWNRNIAALATASLVAIMAWSFTNGMESGINFLALSIMFYWFCHSNGYNWLTGHLKQRLLLGSVLIFVVLCRLDNVILVAIGVGISLGISLCSSRFNWVRALPILGGLGIILMPYFLYNHINTGFFMPLSGVVKQIPAFHPGSALLDWGVATQRMFSTFQNFPISLLTYCGLWLALPVIIILVIQSFRLRSISLVWYSALPISILTHFFYYARFSIEGIYTWYTQLYIFGSVFLIFFVIHWSSVAPRFRSRPFMSTVTLILAFFLAVGLTAWRITKEVQDFVSAESINSLRTSLVLEQLRQDTGASFAGWNAGRTGFLLDGRLTNLDGLMNDAEYAMDYLSQEKTIEYIQKNQFDFIVDYNLFWGAGITDSRWAGMNEDAYETLNSWYSVCYSSREDELYPSYSRIERLSRYNGLLVLVNKGSHRKELCNGLLDHYTDIPDEERAEDGEQKWR